MSLTDTQLLESLSWRYAVKQFDPTKKIPDSTWKSLEELLVLTPSSYGLQPWKFLVIQSTNIRKQLTPLSWNQTQVENCSHFIVFLGKKTITENDIDRFIKRTSEVRGTPAESLAGYKKVILGDLVQGQRSKIIPEWSARQGYIALGNFMTCAALLGVDTCPMEGISPEGYDEVLGLKNSPFRTLVACAAGYRSADDKYQKLKKVRFPLSEVLEQR